MARVGGSIHHIVKSKAGTAGAGGSLSPEFYGKREAVTRQAARLPVGELLIPLAAWEEIARDILPGIYLGAPPENR